MAYANREQFDALREYDGLRDRDEAAFVKDRLLECWEQFLGWLGPCWFGDVPKSEIYALLSSDRSLLGAVAVSACLTSDPLSDGGASDLAILSPDGTSREERGRPKPIPGGVCSITLHAREGLRTYDVVVHGDGFRCWPVGRTWHHRGSYATPRRLLTELCRGVFGDNGWTVVQRPARLERRSAFGVDVVLRGVRDADALSWGPVCSDFEVSDIVDRLNKLKTEEPGRAPAALYVADVYRPGYLYHLVTRGGARYVVAFDTAGFVLLKDSEVLGRFSVIQGMLGYASDELALTVVTPTRPRA